MKKSAISDESKALHKLFRDGEIDHETLEDSMTGLALLPPPQTALSVYSKTNGLDPYLDSVKDKISEFKANPPSLETASGRAEYKSMARKVASFKTALDSMGKELVDELKDVPRKVDAERKRIRELLDFWRDDVRKPVDDWEAEQKAIEEKRLAEEAAAEAQRLAEIAARELQEQVDRDHELAVFMYADYLRQKEEIEKQAIIDAENAAKEQKEREENIAKEAAENARIAAEKELQAAIDRAEREKVEAENARLLQQQQAQQAAEKAKQDAIDAAKKAEEDKQKAIEAERQRVESERLEAERKQQELEKNRAHVGQKRKEAKESLIAICGLSEGTAKAVVLAIAGGKISNTEINY